MATQAEKKRERKDALREVRRRERALDSQIERMERRIFRLLDRKTIIDEDDAVGLYDKYYKPAVDLMKSLERGLIDFYGVSSNY